jgi:diadenosine tetraphosphatase ApaH/serine/threonine PP2A family protein phosphatase
VRYLVLTDIHANLEALDACVADARARGFDRTLVLGDLVGYGADPNPVIERVQALEPFAVVRGNHDKVACGLESSEGFNVTAKHAIRWTSDELSPDHRAWLADLPQGPARVDGLMEICHGSPFDEDAYIFDELDAVRALKASARPLCLFGHTHFAVTFELTPNSVETISPVRPRDTHIPLLDGAKYLLNPGAVGQPRDGDPRAGYAIVDDSRQLVELYRVKYPIAEAQEKILKVGLPEVLAQRLAVGR